MNDKIKVYLITGVAGFIGANLAKRILNLQNEKIHIIGIDNLNDYYDVKLKEYRLSELQKFDEFEFIKCDISNKEKIGQIFEKYKPDIVVNLAAQAGVRYSITNPDAYIQSNIIGFYNILECCRKYEIEHLVYASSSSVYGVNKKIPYSTDDKTDNTNNGNADSSTGDAATAPSTESGEGATTGDTARPVVYAVLAMMAAGLVLSVVVYDNRKKRI